jgi:hypothetical protein
MDRGLRIVVLLATSALLAVVAPGVGSSKPAARTACGREEFVAGLEAVFGRFKTQATANAFRAKLLAAGFQGVNVIPGCNEFRVVLRGIESFDVGLELQEEAEHERFPVTLECIAAKDDVGELEAVFGHRRDRFEATLLLNRAAAFGFQGLQLESDPCGGFEVMLKGFTSDAQAQDFVAEAKAAGFDVELERS